MTASDDAEDLPALRDDDRRTVWRADGLGPGSRPWVLVDLGAPQLVAGVRCVPADPNAPGIYLADIELSVDGYHWDPADVRFRPDSLATLLEHPRDLDAYVARIPTRVARYVRIRSPMIGFFHWPWEIAELYVEVDCSRAAVPGRDPRTCLWSKMEGESVAR